MKFFNVLLILLLAGCSSVGINEKSTMVNVGDSKTDVMGKLGSPENRQLKGPLEAWQYCETNFGQYNFLIVWFEDGSVSGVNTQTLGGRPFSGCNSNFSSVNWQLAPDKIIEIRNR